MNIHQILLVLRFLAMAIFFLLFVIQIGMILFGNRRRKGRKRRLLFYAILLAVVTWIPPKVSTQFGIKTPILPIKSQTASWPAYYNQEDPAWAKELYGKTDYIEDTGCGPTVLAMVVSALGDTKINPKQMADWSYENGYCSQGYGSYHTLIAEGLAAYGIETTTTNDGAEVKAALQSGYPVIALMGEGHFTGSGHFLLLYDIDSKNKVSLADPKSKENSAKIWDLDTILQEAKISPTTNGAYWIIKKQVVD